MKFQRKNIAIVIIVVVYLLIFCSISLVNHFFFRTYAFDLGINNNAIFDYAHFRWNDCMLMQPQYTNVLSDHFSIIPILVSPLYWIFGSYTMLIVQIAGIIFGGLGVYVYFSARTSNLWIPNLAAIHFFSIWGIYSALSFDYHDNVMAAMFVPWFLHYFNLAKWQKALPFFLLIIISKENMALWMAFICVGLILNNLKNRKLIIHASIFCTIAVFYFFGIIKFVIPALANEGREYLHFHYSALGGNFSDAFKNIFRDPLHIIKLLFLNQYDYYPIAEGIKTELHYMVLLCGGIAFLLRPAYLIMLIPIYAQKLFNDDIVKWGLNMHYSIEFAPILSIALFSFIIEIKNQKLKNIIALFSVLICIYSTGWKLDNRKSPWYVTETNRFYQSRHYKRAFDIKELKEALKLIPDSAVLSAQSFIVPHVSFRDYIYQYPLVKNAGYIIFMTGEFPYPLSFEEFEKKKQEYLSSENWENIYNKNKTLIFKKRNLIP